MGYVKIQIRAGEWSFKTIDLAKFLTNFTGLLVSFFFIWFCARYNLDFVFHKAVSESRYSARLRPSRKTDLLYYFYKLTSERLRVCLGFSQCLAFTVNTPYILFSKMGSLSIFEEISTSCTGKQNYISISLIKHG